MTPKEAIQDLHDRVRQCFTRHQFKTFGDAITWLHKEDFEILEMEAGEQGFSKFSTDILWLISHFGPKTEVDHSIIDVRKVPALKKVKIIELDDTEKVTASIPLTKTAPRKRKTRRRRF